MGFDLVTFSGGKGIRGPQSAGLLLGRKDLIAAARLNAPPNGNTIGRGMKVNKEEIVGMLAALELYLKKDHAREQQDFERRAETIRSSARSRRRREGRSLHARSRQPRAARSRHLGRRRDSPRRPRQSSSAMRDGEPSIAIRSEGPALVIGVWMMRPGEDKIVAKRLRQVLEKE